MSKQVVEFNVTVRLEVDGPVPEDELLVRGIKEGKHTINSIDKYEDEVWYAGAIFEGDMIISREKVHAGKDASFVIEQEHSVEDMEIAQDLTSLSTAIGTC